MDDRCLRQTERRVARSGSPCDRHSSRNESVTAANPARQRPSRRRQLRDVSHLAAGTISHRMSRQRLCVFNLSRTFCLGMGHVPCGSWNPVFPDDRHAGGVDFNHICRGPLASALWQGNSRQTTAGLNCGERATSEHNPVLGTCCYHAAQSAQLSPWCECRGKRFRPSDS